MLVKKILTLLLLVQQFKLKSLKNKLTSLLILLVQLDKNLLKFLKDMSHRLSKMMDCLFQQALMPHLTLKIKLKMCFQCIEQLLEKSWIWKTYQLMMTNDMINLDIFAKLYNI